MTEQKYSGQWAKISVDPSGSDVEVIDCTLRDGEQAPGVWLTIDQKVELARLLSEAGVDVLDAGFPASGKDEIDALRAMRKVGLSAKVGATSRLIRRDIEAVLEAEAEVIFLFAPVSDVQFERTLNLSRQRLMALFVDCTRMAASAGLEVSVVLGDATHADVNLVRRLAELCQELPVQRLILSDSMGAAMPAAILELVRTVHVAVPQQRLCVHCHNDFGMATANTVCALAAGASSFTATVNGIGERAGNADLAEVLASTTHLLKRRHGVDPTHLPQLSRRVEMMTGIHMSPIKPVTGMNVYRHESGIHVDAILKEPTSYQSLPPAWTNSRMELVLGKHSGAAQVRAILQSRHLPSDPVTVARVMDTLKQCRHLCDRQDLEEVFHSVEQFRRRVLSGIPIDLFLEQALRGRATNCEAG